MVKFSWLTIEFLGEEHVYEEDQSCFQQMRWVVYGTQKPN